MKGYLGLATMSTFLDHGKKSERPRPWASARSIIGRIRSARPCPPAGLRITNGDVDGARETPVEAGASAGWFGSLIMEGSFLPPRFCRTIVQARYTVKLGGTDLPPS